MMVMMVIMMMMVVIIYYDDGDYGVGDNDDVIVIDYDGDDGDYD